MIATFKWRRQGTASEEGIEGEAERERTSERRSVNEWDRVLSISLGQIDHQADGSVTLNKLCVCVCVCECFNTALLLLQMRSAP